MGRQILENHGSMLRNLGFGITPPYVTKKRFSELSGLQEEVIRGMIDKGHLPTVKIGRYRLVNLTLMAKEALEQDH